MLDGIFNVYKEKGYTSHDVVAKLRGIAGQRKIGHTGTLDPDAEGVLPVCLGKATKVCDVLTDKSKTYQAVLLLGRRTDTQDISGTCLEERDASILALEDVERAVKSFLGDYLQTPPMYSALKVGGKKLYELAREGKTVEREARKVQIYRIEIHKIDLPRVWLEVECSKGTYIRTLCDDIGEILGVGGCMEKLLRTRVGKFRIEDCVKLSDLQKYRDAGTLAEHLIPVDKVFENCPRVDVPKHQEALLYNGNSLRRQGQTGEAAEIKDGDVVRMYDCSGHFIALYRYQQKNNLYKNEKMFFSP